MLSMVLVVVVVGIALVSGSEATDIEFPSVKDENFTVEQGEWFEHGYWDEDLSDTELVEDEDGWLVMDNPSSGAEAVWRSNVSSPEISHSFYNGEVFTDDIVLEGDKPQRVVFQLYCLEDESVIYEQVLFDGGQDFTFEDVERSGAYEVRLIFETESNTSPRVRDFTVKYVAEYFSGVSMDYLVEFFVLLLLGVFVGSFFVGK